MQRLPRRLTSLAAAVLSLAAMLAPAAAADAIPLLRARPPAAPRPAGFVPGEVVVKFRPEAGAAKRDPLAGALGLVREEHVSRIEVDRYTIAGGGDVMETVRRLRQRPDVLYAEPNYLVSLAAVPNDPFYGGFDGYARDLQRWTFGGVAGNAGINAEAAWDVTTGRPDVAIAVIDSGVALTHGDLAPNLWTNPGEIPNNGRDDDANGFVDDVHGWDFFSNDADPSPDLGENIDGNGDGVADSHVFHGTFVANMAAGRGNDGSGVLGAAWNCRVMPIKIFTYDGYTSTVLIAKAFRYAADNGADVVNASLSGPRSTVVEAEVAYAIGRGCVVVAAAGNDNSPNSTYPARYPGVLSVGASGHAFESPDQAFDWGPPSLGGRATFSQYGAGAVDVVAPGIVFSSSVASKADAVADPSLQPGDAIGLVAGGTSFAAPIVAGLAALMISRDKDLNGGVRTLTNERVKEIVETTAVDLPDDPIDSPNAGPGWDGRGMVDFVAALEEITGGPGGRAVRLRWKAPSSGEPLAAPIELEADEPQAAGDVAPGRRLAPGNAARGLRPQAPELAAEKSPAGDVAEREPNNTLATAQPLAIPSVVAGQIATSDEGPVTIVYDGVPSDVVEDLYRFSLAEEASVSITLTPAGNSDLDLALLTDLDGDGEYTVEQQFLSNTPWTEDEADQVEELAPLLPAGTYYIAATIYDGAPLVSSDAYTLALASGAPVVAGYRVYRSASPDVAPVEANRIAQTAGSQLTFLDTGAPGGAVYYVVTALYDAGESAPSNEASPGAVNPNAPAILSPAYKKGKLMMAAAESKIVAGSTLVVDDSESFTLTLAKNGSRWVVKKKARSAPGNRRVSEVLAPGRDAVLYVITPGGLRSAPVTFRRP